MRLLIIGVNNMNLQRAGEIAFSRGAKVTMAETLEDALSRLTSGEGADLIFIELGLNIASLIESLEQRLIKIPVIACGYESDTKSAVSAIKAGAVEYLPLPPDEELIATILSSIADDKVSLSSKSDAMQEVLDIAERVAGTNATILITGESGTGKEVMARYVHNLSPRASDNFVAINCAAIPETLLESELFGYEKGAFTGAVSRRIGKFEEANNGTILLDEISEIDPRIQAKLLRVLQEKEFYRIGGNNVVKVNTRIIAATNRDLAVEVREGRFREDLFHRLNVINLALPPLRNRLQDIVDLAKMFADKYSDASGISRKELSQGTIDRLLNYAWPGNIRELENTMYRAVLLEVSNVITEASLQLKAANVNAIDAKDNLVAARILGVQVRKLEEKIS